ncbi:MAG: hydrogenase iron-sulfur subunit [Deltaproteobacteria bacterium]|nr:hydrogenase iron-sulfur subunit [Deltaproteobacteria bacterium]
MFARRKFSAIKNLLEYMGLEPGRLHFSWISSAEAEKFATTATKVMDAVRPLGPANFMKKLPLDKVA